MNPAVAVLRKVDGVQQRFRPTAFVVGVLKKFGDDNGGVLVANLTYAAFVSFFPLLLVLVTVLGIVAANYPAFRQDAVNAVAGQVPLVGHTLAGNVHQLQKSSFIGLGIGLGALVWGTSRLGQAGLFTMTQVWNLPGPARPGFFPRIGRSLLFIVLLGAVVITTTLMAGLSTWGNHTMALVLAIEAVQAAVNAGMYFTGFRILTARGVPSRSLVPGAVMAGVCWTALQVAGAYLVHHYLHTDSVYGVFATVLGLVAWLYIAARITVYSAEVNVVLTRRLWPRSLVQPPLTDADRVSMSLQAMQGQRRVEQLVTVTFKDQELLGEPADAGAPYVVEPSTPEPGLQEGIAPPAPRPPLPEEGGVTAGRPGSGGG